MVKIMSWYEIIFYIIGGLGIFLYGVNFMGSSLKAMAGNRLKTIIEKSTNTPIKGVLVGFFVTFIIQSSSGSTALMVTLVAAGLMSLTQAIYVIIGANIGATTTSILIGLNFTQFALPIFGIGALISFMAKRKKIKNIGNILLGFGMLFYGLKLMGDGFGDFSKTNAAMQLMQTFSKFPILALLFGILFTAIVQSSGATIGMIQSLYMVGSIDLKASNAFMLGACIGTTITAIIASFGSTKSAKQVSFMHLVYNIIGAILFMILLTPFTSFMQVIENNFLLKIGCNKMMSVAFANFIFKLLTGILIFFFAKSMVKFSDKIIKGKEERDIIKQLETLEIKDTAFALEYSKKAILELFDMTLKMFDYTSTYALENNNKFYDDGMELEDEIDDVEKKIHDYLIKISQLSLDKNQSYTLAKDLDTIRDLERISDHCCNLLEFFARRYENNEIYSADGLAELKDALNLTSQMLKNSQVSFLNQDVEAANAVLEMEERMDDITENYRKNHLIRVYKGVCKVSMVDNYSEILSNFERMGDHCTNIVEKVKSGNAYFEKKGENQNA